MGLRRGTRIAHGMVTLMFVLSATAQAAEYRGRYCEGKGDLEYLRLIDRSFGFFHPCPDAPNISMLYKPEWDALVEGANWGMWWIQNSYGPTYCALPFLQEPWLTALQHSQDFWLDHQGDGKTECMHTEVIAPDGALCDAASPSGAIYRQGDCKWKMHDWGYEFTAAGVVMQAELLLISRDKEAVRRYLPRLERACEFIEARRDPKNDLFLVGPAANLLAPSYGGVRQPDGSFGKAYLTGLSVTYTAALDRMIELQKLAGNKDKAALYESRRKLTKDSLAQLTAGEGYLVKSMERDGTKHGVYGQEKYGYFESVCNVDAVAFRVADQAQAEKIHAKIASIPQLRPHGFIITNYPSLDDTYEFWGSAETTGLWEFGRWVNGGVWHTVEARAILGYYRLGKHEDVRRSWLAFGRFADGFQMDAPLTQFGKEVWFKDKPANLCYDALGIPAATVRGLFEYVYRADGLTLYPHIPPSIREYKQKEPVRFGEKRITLSVKNGGPRIKSLEVNGKAWKVDAPDHVTLPYDSLPKEARVELVTEGGWPEDTAPEDDTAVGIVELDVEKVHLPGALRNPYAALTAMQKRITGEPNAEYERAFVGEAVAAFDAYKQRVAGDAAGWYPKAKPEKQAAILRMYEDAALNLYKGFDGLMKRYAAGEDPQRRRMAGSWLEAPPQDAGPTAEKG